MGNLGTMIMNHNDLQTVDVPHLSYFTGWYIVILKS